MYQVEKPKLSWTELELIEGILNRTPKKVLSKDCFLTEKGIKKVNLISTRIGDVLSYRFFGVKIDRKKANRGIAREKKRGS